MSRQSPGLARCTTAELQEKTGLEAARFMRIAREAAGLTQEQAAEFLGVDAATIYRTETGKTCAKAWMLLAWRDYLVRMGIPLPEESMNFRSRTSGSGQYVISLPDGLKKETA